MGMKLYIWRDVLCDYTCGMIVAMAENVAEAREVVLAQARRRREGSYRIAQLAEGVQSTPTKIARRRFADWVSGGG